MASESPRSRLRWLVTAGPTCEDIDPVRFISNRSSGTMGYSVARAALARGDEVTLVTGPVGIEPPDGCELVRVRSAEEMFEAVVGRFDAVDIVIMAAAVADYRPKGCARAKIRKDDRDLVIELTRTRDVLTELGRLKRGQILVGFALETPPEGEGPADPGPSASMRHSAERKLREKNLDVVVLNDPRAMGAQRGAVSVLRRLPAACLCGSRQVRQGALAGQEAGAAAWEDWGEAAKDDHAVRLVALAACLPLPPA